MAANNYRDFTVEMPCGHVYEGIGPQRAKNSTRVPITDTISVSCFCGWKGVVEFAPVLMVVGYKGRVVS